MGKWLYTQKYNLIGVEPVRNKNNYRRSNYRTQICLINNNDNNNNNKFKKLNQWLTAPKGATPVN